MWLRSVATALILGAVLLSVSCERLLGDNAAPAPTPPSAPVVSAPTNPGENQYSFAPGNFSNLPGLAELLEKSKTDDTKRVSRYVYPKLNSKTQSLVSLCSQKDDAACDKLRFSLTGDFNKLLGKEGEELYNAERFEEVKQQNQDEWGAEIEPLVNEQNLSDDRRAHLNRRLLDIAYKGYIKKWGPPANPPATGAEAPGKTVSDTSLSELRQDLGEARKRIDKIENNELFKNPNNPPVRQEDISLLGVVPAWFLLLSLGLLSVLALALAGISLFASRRRTLGGYGSQGRQTAGSGAETSQDNAPGLLSPNQLAPAAYPPKPVSPAKSEGGEVRNNVNALIEETKRLGQQLNAAERRHEETLAALRSLAEWVAIAHQPAAQAGANDPQRAAAQAVLETHYQPVRRLVERIEPLAQAVNALGSKLRQNSNSAEHTARVGALQEDLRGFSRARADLDRLKEALEQKATTNKPDEWNDEQEKLFAQAKAKSISVAELVGQLRALHNRAAQAAPAALPVSLPDEAKLQELQRNAPDFLMDWFDNFTRLRQQLPPSPAGDMAADLSEIHRAACRALGQFEIQPEVITVGQTVYDSRLHDVKSIKPSQYPAKTIIEILECGFRRNSGEVLRRPQVTVSGTGEM
jgi:hypothetical protein